MLQATASHGTLQGGRQTGRGRVERDLSQLSNAYDQSKKEKKCLAVSPTPPPFSLGVVVVVIRETGFFSSRRNCVDDSPVYMRRR